MNLPVQTIEEKCSRQKIAFYLDGELSPSDEILLEKHFTVCRDCLSELNLQKRLLSVLDSTFDKETEIKLPENFAKIVATRAQTSVKGLNSRRERTSAFFICITLFLIAAIALGVKELIFSLNKFGEQALAVASFIGHLAYELIIGLTVILRSIGNQPIFNSAIIFLFLIIAFSAVVLSRRLENSNRS